MRGGALIAGTIAFLALSGAPAQAETVWEPAPEIVMDGRYPSEIHAIAAEDGAAIAVIGEESLPDANAGAALKVITRLPGQDPVTQVLDESVSSRCYIKIAENSSGTVAVMFEGRDGFRVAIRRPGGLFETPQPVSAGGNSSPVMAMNESGDIAVMTGHLFAGPRDPSPSTWTFTASVSVGGGPFSDPQRTFETGVRDIAGYDVAIGPDRSLTAIWGEAIGSTGSYNSPPPTSWAIRAARAEAGQAAGAIQTLAESQAKLSCPRLHADAGGRLAAIWNEGCASGLRELGVAEAGGLLEILPIPLLENERVHGMGMGHDGTLLLETNGGLLLGGLGEPIARLPPLERQIQARSVAAGGEVLVASEILHSWGPDPDANVVTYRLGDDGTWSDPVDLPHVIKAGWLSIDTNSAGRGALVARTPRGALFAWEQTAPAPVAGERPPVGIPGEQPPVNLDREAPLVELRVRHSTRRVVRVSIRCNERCSISPTFTLGKRRLANRHLRPSFGPTGGRVTVLLPRRRNGGLRAEVRAIDDHGNRRVIRRSLSRGRLVP